MSRILKISQGDYKVQASSTNSILLEAGSVVINGDFTVLGAASYITTTDTTVSDNILILNKGETGTGISPRNSLRTSGIEIDRGLDGSIPLSARFVFDESLAHYDPATNTNINGTFLLQSTRGSSTGLNSLQLN